MTTFTEEELAASVLAFREHGSKQAAADALGVSRSAMRRRLARAGELGMLGTSPVVPGFAIKSIASKVGDAWVRQGKAPGEVFEVPDGHAVKGVSALVDPEGREVLKWVKTRESPSAIDIAETLKAAFLEYEPAAAPVPAPLHVQDDVLTLVPCGDWHINLLTWARETGENWDLRISERVIGGAVDDAIDRSPAADTCIVLGGGDLVHSDNNENRTARSGNALDCDGRHQKGLEVACRLMVRTIDRALLRNRHVIARVLPGNHDEHTAVAVAYFLLAWYRNEPRVTVDADASLFFWHRFGKVLIGATHGHTVKLRDMPAIMAHRRAEDWGATKYRYIHGFHIHHSSKFATEGAGCICESHQAPIPQDAWHYGAGFLSGRSIQTIQYHRDMGEVGRVRVAVLDGAAAEQSRAAA